MGLYQVYEEGTDLRGVKKKVSQMSSKSLSSGTKGCPSAIKECKEGDAEEGVMSVVWDVRGPAWFVVLVLKRATHCSLYKTSVLKPDQSYLFKNIMQDNTEQGKDLWTV